MIELAIDMGTSNTYIFQKGEGLILKEPSVAAVSTGVDKSVKAIGWEAKKLLGKTPGDLTVVFPLFEGVIVSANMAAVMLKYFLGKIIPRRVFRPKIKALFTVPCGLEEKDKQLIETAAYDAGVSEVVFIEKITAAALGVNAPISNARTCLIVDIGGGTTEIGVVSLTGIINGFSLCLAGYNADTAIIDALADNFGVKIGLASAEKIKINAGSLLSRDNMSASVTGIDVAKNTPMQLQVKSGDIKPVMEKVYGKIFDVVKSIVKILPGEVGGDLLEHGLYLTGGAAQIAGLDSFIRTRLDFPVHFASDPFAATVSGAGKIISNADLYNHFFLSREQSF